MYNVLVNSVFFGELMKELLLVLEILGTVAFAASGAMVAIKKGMDMVEASESVIRKSTEIFK